MSDNVQIDNQVINNFKNMTRGEINVSIALYAFINDNLDKVQFDLTNYELKQLSKYQGRESAIDVLIRLKDNFDNVTLRKDNNRLIVTKANNKLLHDYTTINLDTIVKLPTKIEKILYILMIQNKDTGSVEMDIDTFQNKVGTSASNRKVKSRIIKACTSLNDTFNGLISEITWKHVNRTGHKKVNGFIIPFNINRIVDSFNEEQRNLGQDTKVTELKSEIETLKKELALKNEIIDLRNKLKAKDEEITKLKAMLSEKRNLGNKQNFNDWYNSIN